METSFYRIEEAFANQPTVNLPKRKYFKKRSSYQLAVLTEILSPILHIGARAAVPSKPSSPQQWKRALIVGDTHIGDLLYRTCSLTQLKYGLPQCDFYYLTAADGAAKILEGNPALAGILPLRKSDNLSDLKDGGWEQLRELKFDAIFCTNAVRAWPELVMALKLKIPNRIAFAHRGLSGFITHPVWPGFPEPFPAYFRDMVSAVSGQSPDWPLRPLVYPEKEDREQAEKLWETFGYKSFEKVIACFVTARQQNGVWPAEWFGKVLQSVQKSSGYRIVLCGAGGDKARLETLRKEFGLTAEINAGLLGLKSLVVFLSKCQLAVTQDSGPRHLSNAANIPVVFPRNIAVEAIETGVYCETETDLVPLHFNRLPIEQQSRVLEEVPPIKGVEAILSRL